MNKPWCEKLVEVEEEILRCLQRLRQIEEETGLTIEQVKDINRRMSIGEAKARRAKKRWLKRTCVWLFRSRKIYQPWFAVP